MALQGTEANPALNLPRPPPNLQIKQKLDEDVAGVTQVMRQLFQEVRAEASHYKDNRDGLRDTVKRAGDAGMTYVSSAVQGVSANMLPPDQDMETYLADIAKKIKELYEKPLNANEVNDMCQQADVTPKTNFDEMGNHFAPKHLPGQVGPQGSTPHVKRQASSDEMKKALRYPVVPMKEAFQLTGYGPGGQSAPTAHAEVRRFIEWFLRLLPGGGKKLKWEPDSEKVLAQEQEAEEWLHGKHGEVNAQTIRDKFKRARIVVARQGDSNSTPPCITEFEVMGNATQSMGSYARASEARSDHPRGELRNEAVTMITCGMLVTEFQTEDSITPFEAITRLHEEMVKIVEVAFVTCMKYIVAGAPADAMELAAKMADMRHGDACDINLIISNYCLFMALHAGARAVQALFLWIREGDEELENGATCLVQAALLDASLEMQEALEFKRPDGLPGFLEDGQAGVNMAESARGILHAIQDLLEKSQKNFSLLACRSGGRRSADMREGSERDSGSHTSEVASDDESDE